MPMWQSEARNASEWQRQADAIEQLVTRQRAEVSEAVRKMGSPLKPLWKAVLVEQTMEATEEFVRAIVRDELATRGRR
jgi:hypothetical protein